MKKHTQPNMREIQKKGSFEKKHGIRNLILERKMRP